MKKFLKTVAIVTVFSAFERLLGFLYRIYLSRNLGSEGMGIYQLVLTVFATFLTLSSSGIPITVSRLMTKYRAEGKEKSVRAVMTAGIFIAVCISAVALLFYVIFKDFLCARIFTDSRCKHILNIILPTLVLCSVYNVLRGVLWGNKNFLPYSIVDLIEEIVMIVFGIILINNATTLFSAVKRAGVAVAISYCVSFLLMCGYFIFKKTKLSSPLPQFKPLLKAATPITVMRVANSLITSLVAIILPVMLVKNGISIEQAMADFGSAFGMAMPLLSIPSTIISGFTVVLVPEVAENYYSGRFDKLKEDTEKAIKFSTFATCVFLPIFAVLGEQIGVFVYGDFMSGKYLAIATPIMLPMGVSMITTSILNSVGEEKKTLLYFTITAVFMLLSVIALPKLCGIYSLLIGYALTFTLTAGLNIRLIYKKNKERPVFIKSSLIMLGCALPTYVFGIQLKGLLMKLCSTNITMFICCGIMPLFYVAILACFSPIKLKGMLKLLKQK